MSPRRERIAWLLFVGIIALVALKGQPGVSPTQRDLEFARTVMELREQVSRRYVREVSDAQLRDAAVRGMMGALDEFSEYVPPSDVAQFEMDVRGGYHGVGILIERSDDAGGLVVVRPIEGGPAAEAGVRPGDQVVAVDGEDITALEQTQIVEKIKGPPDSSVTLTIERGPRDGPADSRQRLDLTMPRREVASPVLEGYRLDDQGQPVFWVDPDAPVKLGYVRLTRFTSNSAAGLAQVVERLLNEGAQGLVLDLRFNPGGLLNEAVAMADLFLEEGVIVSKRGANSPEETAVASGPGTLRRVPMVVVVNEFSASASEVLAGALADHERATIVGVRTFGKGSVQDVINLSNRAELKLTTAYYYTPDGRVVHKAKGAAEWGIAPDVEVKVDYADPVQVGVRNRQPPFPKQTDAAVEVLLGLIAAEQIGTRPATQAGGQNVRPLEQREGPAAPQSTQPASRPAR